VTSSLVFDLVARDKSLSDTFSKAGRGADAAGKQMNSAFAGASKSITAELDKIEKAAWESGKGLSTEFSAALAVVRDDLGQVTDAARKTGAGLDSELGTALLDVRKAMEELRPVADDAGDAVKQAAVQMDKAFDSAAASIESDIEDIKRAAWESGRGMDREFSRALQGLQQDLDRVRGDAARTGAGLESDIGGALRDVRKEAARLKEQLDEVGDSASGAGGIGEALGESLSGGFDAGGLVEGLVGSVGGGAAVGAAAAAGAVLGAAMWDACAGVFESRELGGVIAAQQGSTARAAGKLGDIAGSAYYDGFADSIETGAAALSGVLSQGLVDTGASQAEIQELTNMAATAATVVGEDADRIARAAKVLLVTGLADNAKQAIDIIVSASQDGANVTGDLIDTIEEYSTKFRDLGLNGEQAVGLISQAMAAGARDTDFAADALKEFAIRAQDGSEATARGFEALGLDARQMGQDIAAGGDSARDALDETLDRLRAIEDPVVRNQAAVDLFGTKAEDLGDALFAMDLDDVASQFQSVEGATAQAAATMEATRSPIDKMGRAFENFGNAIATAMFAMGGAANEGEGVERKFEKAGRETSRFKTESEGLAGKLDAAKDATRGVAEESAIYADTLGEIISAQHELSQAVVTAEQANLNYQAALDDVQQSLIDNGKTLNENTEAGRNNKQSLLGMNDSIWDVIASMEQQGAGAEEVTAFMGQAREQFIKTAISMGASAAEARGLADRLGLIPGNYVAEVRADTSNAQRKLKELELYINWATRNRTINVGVAGSGLSFWDHRAEGGPVKQGDPYLVGEKGMELFVPDSSGTIIPNDVLMDSANRLRPPMSSDGASGGRGTAPVAGYIEVSGDADSMLADWLKTLERRGYIKFGIR
jgi:phage-related minor tail protein